ncbi:MAG: DUF5687 family protein [Prevotella sp.]|nr:DUF5687 family protein [Prevotella sp.]
MRRLRLYNTLRTHRRLALRRMPDGERDRLAGRLMACIVAFALVLLCAFGVLLALTANARADVSPAEYICRGLPVIMAGDFLCRLTLFQTPPQVIKPYILLPLPKYVCIDFFVLQGLSERVNLVWAALLVPYSLLAVAGSDGISAVVILLVFFWFVSLSVGQLHLIVRTLAADRPLWWLFPVALLLIALFAPGMVTGCTGFGDAGLALRSYVAQSLVFYGQTGRAIADGSILPCLSAAVILLILLVINRRVQYSGVMKEAVRTDGTIPAGRINLLARLGRRGNTAAFLAVEALSLMRNKNPRKSLLTAVLTAVAVSFLIVFTDIYDVSYMESYWCLYNYLLFGTVALARVMCYEGNYFDCLMTRKELLFAAFKAKYIFNCLLLVIPFVLMLPTVMTGKRTLLQLVAYAVFTAGFQFCLLFQLAATNRTTRPLNTRLT